MRFLACENCDFAVVRALRDAGHDVVAVRDTKPGEPDEAVISLALRESRVLLTEDKGFGQLVFASAVESPGVVFIRFPASARQDMARTVVKLVETSAEKIMGRFVVVQPGRIRISERMPEK
ncbi:MAG TPA: DUF5615 family PIN-like protein [Methylococcus sp.]|nr:DUF5615 family PIN-like protein [Methylococcus sp.]